METCAAAKNMLALVWSICLLAVPCPAQFSEPLVTIEHPEPVKVQTLQDWQGSLLLGFNFAQGNTESMLIDVSAQVSGEKRKNIWRFSGGHRFGESEDETDTDNSDAAADYKRLLNKRTYVGFMSTFNRDEISDVSYRVVAAPTIGHFLVKEDDARFNIEAGPGYLFEKVGGVEDDYFDPFLSERLEYLVNSSAKLFEAVQVHFDIRDEENVLVTAQAGIQTSVTKVLSLVVMVEETFDSQPAEGKQKNDIKLVTSLAYHF